MQLYTERHGIRAPKERTYHINIDTYYLLFNCCKKYKNNLIHLFTAHNHDDFTDTDYVIFDNKSFITKIRVLIPSLFKDEYGILCTPAPTDKYDQYALLDFIEYFAYNIQDISEYWNHNIYRNYKIIDCLNSDKVFTNFQNEINNIFIETGLLYKLTDQKVVERIVENSPLSEDILKNINTIKEDETKKLLKDAVALYKTPNPATRQDSVEKIWDALERLKTYYTQVSKKNSIDKIVNDMANGNQKYIDLFNDEFKSLTSIGNHYRIRHHETDKINITDNRYYDYFFNRCLSLIALAIQYLQ